MLIRRSLNSRALGRRWAHGYSSTLNLPSSILANRSNPRKYPELLQLTGSDLYNWQAKNLPGPSRILHDGPPYANGELHLGHALNKVLKDMINRYNVQAGTQVNYIPGWDCHGLPIELASLKEAEAKGKTPRFIGERRRWASELANKMVAKQKKSFINFGIMADWNKTYQTMNSDYVVRQLKVFATLLHKGLIFRQRKPVFWSCESNTALAESELQYGLKVDTSVYVAFPIEGSDHALSRDLQGSSFIIWTTTPWTLPSNQAVALGEDIVYCLVETDSSPSRRFVLAKSLAAEVMKHIGEEKFRVLKSWKGTDFNGLYYRSPLTEGVKPVILADHVTEISGSGIVHTAPGHGKEDYLVANYLGVLSPIDDAGRYNDDLPEELNCLKGLDARKEGTIKVLELLKDKNALLHQHKIEHSVPLDWRSKTPVMLRSTPQFFINLSDVKEHALKALESVTFKPANGKTRLESFIKSRTEWCVSRQRVWGVPIPVLHDRSSGEPLLDENAVSHIIETIDALGDKGMAEWFREESDVSRWIPESLLKVRPELATSLKKGTDTMDVWFDSGSSWSQFDESELPVQVYLEGSDQHRGWFQSSLLTYVSSHSNSKAPYKEVITHGFILDENLQKMSKSLQNVVSPTDLIEGSKDFPALGIDGLRLYIAQTDYTSDISLSPATIKQVAAALKKLRLTFKFMLGNLNDFALKDESYQLGLLDGLALLKLQELSDSTKEAYDQHNFNHVVKQVQVHMNNFLSAFYFDISKDILYTEAAHSPRRRAIQYVLHETLAAYTRILAPIVPLLTQEVWSVCPDTITKGLGSPGMAGWPQIAKADNALKQESFEKLLSFRDCVNELLEKARADKKLGSSLASELYIENAADEEVLKLLEPGLAEIFLVSKVIFSEPPSDSEWSYQALSGSVKFTVRPPTMHKCPRCWQYTSPANEQLCGRCDQVVADLT